MFKYLYDYNQKFKVWENIPEKVRLLAVFFILLLNIISLFDIS